jgi:hypothetical protein
MGASARRVPTARPWRGSRPFWSRRQCCTAGAGVQFPPLARGGGGMRVPEGYAMGPCGCTGPRFLCGYPCWQLSGDRRRSCRCGGRRRAAGAAGGRRSVALSSRWDAGWVGGEREIWGRCSRGTRGAEMAPSGAESVKASGSFPKSSAFFSRRTGLFLLVPRLLSHSPVGPSLSREYRRAINGVPCGPWGW